MKIRTWIKYEESYLPPRCRKLRYKQCEEFVDIELKEVSKDELMLAFEDNSFEGRGKIFSYGGKLWYKAKMPTHDIVERYGFLTPLDYLKWCNEKCSTYFKFALDRERYGEDTSRKSVIENASNDMTGYILVNGQLYKACNEPRYVVMTFGLGHNHGGTGMLCAYGYNPNIERSCYFSALEGDRAVEFANDVAKKRSDTNDVGKFRPFIVCHMPELVMVNRKCKSVKS